MGIESLFNFATITAAEAKKIPVVEIKNIVCSYKSAEIRTENIKLSAKINNTTSKIEGIVLEFFETSHKHKLWLSPADLTEDTIRTSTYYIDKVNTDKIKKVVKKFISDYKLVKK